MVKQQAPNGPARTGPGQNCPLPPLSCLAMFPWLSSHIPPFYFEEMEAENFCDGTNQGTKSKGALQGSPLQTRVGPLSRSTAKELCRGHHCRHRWVRSVGPLHASFCDKHVGLTQEDEYFTGELTLGRICPPMHEMRVRFLGQERSPGEGNGNPLQYSCPGNPMDRGAWRATVHAVQSRTRLSTPAPACP